MEDQRPTVSREAEMQGRSFGARLAFCADLVASLPSPPIEVDARDRETVDLALDALRSGLSQEEMYLKGLSAGLLPIIRLTERRAEETEKREYKPGDNYGFSGAADTSSERYRYTAAYLRVLSSALAADPVQTANGLRGAVRLYAIYSCDTDPKGAVKLAIDEAGSDAENAITRAFAAAPSEWWEKFAWTAQDAVHDGEGDIFISFKNLDAQGRETKDCRMAKTVAVFLRGGGFSVFMSLDSLEQLGKSAYMEAIESALQKAKVLIAVGTSVENLTSRWVKHEWHSFHQDIVEGFKAGGEIFTVVDGVGQRDLPLALRQRQVFPFSQDGLESLARFLHRAFGREVAT